MVAGRVVEGRKTVVQRVSQRSVPGKAAAPSPDYARSLGYGVGASGTRSMHIPFHVKTRWLRRPGHMSLQLLGDR